jgi:hypothetical protein
MVSRLTSLPGQSHMLQPSEPAQELFYQEIEIILHE